MVIYYHNMNKTIEELCKCNDALLTYNLMIQYFDKKIYPHDNLKYADKELYEYRNIQIIQKMLVLNRNINIHNNNDMPFCFACEYGNLEIVNYLINRYNKSINYKSNNYYALKMAIKNCHYEITKILLDNIDSIDYDEFDDYVLEPLCINDNMNMINLVYDKFSGKESIISYCFSYACKHNRYGIAKYLLLENQNILDASIEYDKYFIHDTCLNNHIGIIKLLLSTSDRIVFNINTFIILLEYNNMDMVKIILDYQPDIVNQTIDKNKFYNIKEWSTLEWLKSEYCVLYSQIFRS